MIQTCLHQQAHRRPPPAQASSAYLATVHSTVHDVQPALEDGHLQQGQVSLGHVVKVHGRVGPCGVGPSQAGVLVVDDIRVVG